MIDIGNATVTYNVLAATLVRWLILIVLFVFIRKTHVGRAMQAVSMDSKGASISGVNINKINMFTWGISGFLGAIAGVFFASYYMSFAEDTRIFLDNVLIEYLLMRKGRLFM